MWCALRHPVDACSGVLKHAHGWSKHLKLPLPSTTYPSPGPSQSCHPAGTRFLGGRSPIAPRRGPPEWRCHSLHLVSAETVIPAHVPKVRLAWKCSACEQMPILPCHSRVSVIAGALGDALRLPLPLRTRCKRWRVSRCRKRKAVMYVLGAPSGEHSSVRQGDTVDVVPSTASLTKPRPATWLLLSGGRCASGEFTRHPLIVEWQIS